MQFCAAHDRIEYIHVLLGIIKIAQHHSCRLLKPVDIAAAIFFLAIGRVTYSKHVIARNGSLHTSR